MNISDQASVRMEGVTKIFPGVTALNNMDLTLRAGRIHGLIGENGAGKSTLIKMISGIYRPEHGKIYIDGVERVFNNPVDARNAGIACVYQELNMIKALSVADNLFVGNYICKNSLFIDRKAMNERARTVMQSIGCDVEPTALAGSLGMGQQQMIEISRAILFNARIIMLDEPTSSLGGKEVEQLFKTIRILKEQGKTILFVSHKLEEIFELCDEVTIMRDSRHVITSPVAEMTKDSLIAHMVGRTLDNLYPYQKHAVGEVALHVEGLKKTGVFRNISFEARRGELLGFAGLVGAGRTELFRAIFAADPVDEGRIAINGTATVLRTPGDSVKAGLALIPEDRKHQGLVLLESVNSNIAMVNLKRLCKSLFIDRRKVSDQAEQAVKQLNIKTASIHKSVGELSGGNQQKVVVAKWINSDADIFIFDEPTRGIDVGAKIEIYNIIGELLEKGKCVVIISSELPEIIGLCDRVIVMREGEITANIKRSSTHFNQESIMNAAWGRRLEA